jgi:hypothetical protein
MAPFETALKTFDRRPQFFHVLTAVSTGALRFCFGRRFYRLTEVLTAVSTGNQSF